MPQLQLLTSCLSTCSIILYLNYYHWIRVICQQENWPSSNCGTRAGSGCSGALGHVLLSCGCQLQFRVSIVTTWKPVLVNKLGNIGGIGQRCLNGGNIGLIWKIIGLIWVRGSTWCAFMRSNICSHPPGIWHNLLKGCRVTNCHPWTPPPCVACLGLHMALHW